MAVEDGWVEMLSWVALPGFNTTEFEVVEFSVPLLKVSV